MNSLHRTRTLVSSLLAAGCLALPASTRASAEDDLPAFVSQIDARVIAVVSDGDFLASTYRDNKLAPATDDRPDVVTLIRPGRPSSKVSIPASNSVTSPPEVMAISPDGAFVYVVERLGQRNAATAMTRDLPPGRRVTAIDIRDAAAPKVSGSVDAGPMIESVRISPDGRHLVLSSNSDLDALLQFVPTRDGALGPVQSFKLTDLGIAHREGAPRGGIAVTMADWHPSGRYVSVNLNTRNQVLFAAVETRDDGSVRVSPWGRPVDVGADPFVGRFTPDGGHFISADWGRDFAATSLEGRLPTVPSRLSLIKLAPRGPSAADAKHTVVASLDTDRSTEGLAISRDGRHVATVNMRETAFAPGTPRHTREATISYFSFDHSRSALAKVGDYRFEGVLPEGGSFDATGRHFMATSFEYLPGTDKPAAGLEVWRVGDATKPGLHHIGRVPVAAGAHHVEVSP